MIGVLFGAVVALQPAASTLVARVIDAASGRPLPNAEVIDRVSGSRRFTNEDGEVRIPWSRGGEMSLRVRQIGFQYADRTVKSRPDTAVDTAFFALQPVAYVLPAVRSTAANDCAPQSDTTAALLSASVLAQLRLGAERYEAFRRAYPFRVQLERRTGEVTTAGDVKPTRASLETEHSNRWGERYVPGRLIDRSARGFTVPILFLSNLADSVFWDRHCFIARGVEALGDTRVVRLEFVPTATVTVPDWEGAALVDSVTSMLRRVEFRLTGLRPGDRPRRLEGYTTFRSPSPFIVVPDTTTAIWWRRDVPHGGPWGAADAVQRISVRSITFLRSKPPDIRERLP